MEKQWIENLRKRFEDRKAPAPDGLWESIESAMQTLGGADRQSDAKDRRARIMPLRTRWAAAAAACLIVSAGVVTWLLHREDTSYTAPQQHQHITANVLNGNRQNTDIEEYNNVGTPTALQRTASGNIIAEVKAGSSVTAADTTTYAQPAGTTEYSGTREESGRPTDGNNSESMVIKRKPTHKTSMKEDNDLLLADAGHTMRKDNNMSIAVYGAGITSLGYTSAGGGLSSLPYNVQQDAMPGREVRMMAVAASADKNGTSGSDKVRIKHRQPVRIGMGVRFRLTDRAGIETGMNYSFLSSDITSENRYGGDKTEQRLHYVGIPLNLNYGIWSNRNFEVYALAGGMAEFCVSGKSHTEYLSGQTVTGTADEDIRDKRPQWSVNAQAGVQYNFSELVGVYLEPGVSYYFDNGSDVDNIYKDKPFNFNLNVGLRFTIR